MTGIELLDTYPKSAVVVKQWFLERMLEGLKDENLPEDFKNYVRQQDITNDKIGKLIDASPKALFDIFDSHKLYIETLHETTGFWWKIKDDRDYLRLTSNPVSTRKESDTEAIVEAFKLLNDKI